MLDGGLPRLNSTLPDLFESFAAIAALALFFLAPGFLWGRLSGMAGFRGRSRAEQALWSVAWSLPLAVAMCAIAGRGLSGALLTTLFAALDLAAVLLLARDWKAAKRPLLPACRSTRTMLWLMALFGAYCVFAVTDLQVGHRLYVGTVISDWSVRVAMVKAAMRSAAAGTAVPPINGLSTLSAGGFGRAPHLRYFYFWYVLVAHVARTFHLRAHAALAASCAWAGWSLIAASFLALKYMLGSRLGQNLRRSCFALLLLGCVLGLDILPTALLWLSPHFHPYPEMEWWHQDRTPSFLGAVLYAPHHIAAFCALLVGFLALLLAARPDLHVHAPLHHHLDPQHGRTPWRALLAPAVFAALAFAAAAGTSLFPTFCFVFVLAFWAVDLLRRRDFRTVLALLGAGLLALLFASGYLHELTSGVSAASGFASLRWRNDDLLAMEQARRRLFTGHGTFVALLLRQPVVLLTDFIDLGFYTLVAWQGLRVMRRPSRWASGECALAALILGAAVPAFFLSSTSTSGPNDLGVDAGFLLRLGLQLAAVPWLWSLRQQWRAGELSRSSGAPMPGRRPLLLAAVLGLLGLSAQVYQVLSERLYFPVVGSGVVRKQMDIFTQDRLSRRLYNIRSASAVLSTLLPPSTPDTAAIQFNPVGAMQPANTLYSDRQIASWDTGCGTSYGGDYAHCAPAYHDLLFLFGNTESGVLAGRAENDRQDGAAPRVATLTDFQQTCRALHLSAIMAESTDSIWQRAGSWVWTAPVLTANETVRVLRCPAQ